MDQQTENIPQRSVFESFENELFTFSVILKFWKKSSKSFETKLLGKECKDQESFIHHVKENHGIKSSHCLEEIWVLQKSRPTERKIEWVKEINGRIKIHVPDSYKEFLMKKSETKGKKLFEDPSYED